MLARAPNRKLQRSVNSETGAPGGGRSNRGFERTAMGLAIPEVGARRSSLRRSPRQ
jgi:hypothetical protein